MGSAGVENYGIISIAIDFPLWFILYVIFHELVHYICHILPFTFTYKYNIQMLNENFAEKFKNILSPEYRKKVEINDEQIMNYCRWERHIFHS